MKRFILLPILLSGCTPGLLIPASSASTDTSRARAIIAVIDADEDTYQPALPNDFEDKTGSAADARSDEVTPAPAPIVTAYTKKKGSCVPCDNMKEDMAGYTALDFQYKETGHPEWIKEKLAAGEGYPFVVWKGANGKEFYSHGWPGKAAWLRRYNASLKQAVAGAIMAPFSAVTNQPAAARVSYPIRGNWWSGCDSWRHLTRGEHDGKFDSNWLRSLPNAELQSLHSDDHEGRVQWQYVVRPNSSVVVEHRSSAVSAGVAAPPRRSRPARGLTYSLACPWCPQ